jgi:hypothetical protein
MDARQVEERLRAEYVHLLPAIQKTLTGLLATTFSEIEKTPRSCNECDASIEDEFDQERESRRYPGRDLPPSSISL